MSTADTMRISGRESVFPYVLRFTDLRLYIFVAVLVSLDVAIPWALHRVHPLAGPMFLPMAFFTLLTGLLFGWRAGLLVGSLTPLISSGISGMPVPERLPQVLIENAVFGLSAGLFRERFKFGVLASLLCAMVMGYASLGLVTVVQGTSPLSYVWNVAAQGWPGIAIQLVMLPIILKALNHQFLKRNSRAVD